MKKILGLFAIVLSFGAFAGNNDIYITQTGTGLTLTIDQIGATNTVGTSNSRATLSGTSMTVDIDQIGDSNSFLASILQGNSSSWTWSVTGDSNTGTFAVGQTITKGTGGNTTVVNYTNLSNQENTKTSSTTLCSTSDSSCLWPVGTGMEIEEPPGTAGESRGIES